MIRTPPQHNTTHPPGQVVNEIGVPANPIHQEKTLVQEIEEYQNNNADAISDFHMTKKIRPMETHKEEYRKKVQNGDFK